MPEEWVAFEGPLERLPWGRNTYTVVFVPDQLVRDSAAQGTRRVTGTMNGEPVNLGLNRADVTPETFVWAGTSLQRRLGVTAGEVVDCRLRPADPGEVLVPGDVAEALAQSSRRAAFDALPPAQRRRMLAEVEGAVRPATRQSRIRDLLSRLG